MPRLYRILAAFGSTHFSSPPFRAGHPNASFRDGTAAGTVLVKDIKPGTGYGISFLLHDLFVNVNGTLFFTADNGVNGPETLEEQRDRAWDSDGQGHLGWLA